MKVKSAGSDALYACMDEKIERKQMPRNVCRHVFEIREHHTGVFSNSLNFVGADDSICRCDRIAWGGGRHC